MNTSELPDLRRYGKVECVVATLLGPVAQVARARP
jgi:hypothetical protein